MGFDKSKARYVPGAIIGQTLQEAQALLWAADHGMEVPPEAQARAMETVVSAAGLASSSKASAPWQAGEFVTRDTMRSVGGQDYRCIQPHITQADWPPDQTPALWAVEASGGEEGEPAPWVQPTGAHDAYPLGARVTHSGKVWVSTADANVWEPGAYGWEHSD